MKILSLCLLACVCACASNNELPKAPTAPREITLQPGQSFGDYNGVEWVCGPTVVNDELVWVECSFHNYSTTPKNMCLHVGYTSCYSRGCDGNFIQEVLNHKLTCSGMLAPDDAVRNYVAFADKFNYERARLSKLCGSNLEHCKMITIPTILR